MGFRKALGIGLGFGLGLGLAVGLVLFLASEVEERRIQVQARATAAAVATRAEAQTAARAREQVATAQAEAQATAVAQATRAARKCEDPQRVVLDTRTWWENAPKFAIRAYRYHVSGTARNTCNYPLQVQIDFTALAVDGRVLGSPSPFPPQVDLKEPLGPNEEREFANTIGFFDHPDVASWRIVPRVSD